MDLIIGLIASLFKECIVFLKIPEAKKKAKIGANLFSIYNSLNQILINGYSIVGSLEDYLERMEQHLTKKDDKHALDVGRNSIGYLLVEQRVNIEKFRNALESLFLELNILNGDFVRKIIPLISGKFDALSHLIHVLSQGKMPLQSFTMEEFMDMVKANEKWLSMFHDHDHDIRDYYLCIDQKAQSNFLFKLDKNSIFIPLNKKWDKKIYLQIKEYLAEKNPRETLDEIKNTLETLRESIEKNFSVSDILLEVGGRKH
jgi:hypothetical protein